MKKSEERKTVYDHENFMIIVFEKTENGTTIKEIQIHGKSEVHDNRWRENVHGITQLVRALMSVSETHVGLFDFPILANPSA
jgi:hypothetical protein